MSVVAGGREQPASNPGLGAWAVLGPLPPGRGALMLEAAGSVAFRRHDVQGAAPCHCVAWPRSRDPLSVTRHRRPPGLR